MPQRRVVLVVGPAFSGKTCLLRRLVDGAFPEPPPRRTLGIDLEAGRCTVGGVEGSCGSDGETADVPAGGMEVEFWEMGGRELREPPRGSRIDGILACYDAGDRNSFHRLAHLLCRLRLDAHLSRPSSSAPPGAGAVPCGPRAVLCGTMADRCSASGSPVRQDEVAAFVASHGLAGAALTSARTGAGATALLRALAAAVRGGEAAADAEGAVAAEVAALHAADAWGLPERRPDVAEALSAGGERDRAARGLAGMTSPRGARPQEPPRPGGRVTRGASAAPLVDTFGPGGRPMPVPRPVASCLERGLAHRAVHVWLCVPRTGGVLLRKWGREAAKHGRRWGPTVHGEVRCYGAGGDGHAAELAAQAAERELTEQLGLSAGGTNVGQLEHWFSCAMEDGSCKELVDVFVADIEGGGLPPLPLRPGEAVDWVFCGHVFEEHCPGAELLFHMRKEYRASMLRRCRARLVRADVANAFGEVL